MNQLVESCNNFLEFPKNIVHHDALEHSLRAYLTRLNEHAHRLFVNEDSAALDFLDLIDGDQGWTRTIAEFQPSCVRNLAELRGQLREALRDQSSDPQCRFIFIHARHSRDPLKISHSMLCFLFSYLQVMPSYLDFIFPFGDQEYAQDFHFSGWKEENFLEIRPRGLEIPKLGRSGREMRLCYNLMSVEESRDQIDLPWSIRQTAVYHSFDFETRKSVWITVKGNEVIKERISDATKSSRASRFGSSNDAFSASLAIHLLLCDLSGENWRWYIKDLENALQDLTRNILCTVVDRLPSLVLEPMVIPTTGPMSPRSYTGTFSAPSRTGTKQSLMSPRGRSGTFSTLSLAPTGTISNLSQAPTATTEETCEGKWAKFAIGTPQTLKQSLTSLYQYETRLEPPDLPPELSEDDDPSSQKNFKFSDLQRIQYIEEKTQEALLVLKLNTEILEELRQHYIYVTNQSAFPPELARACGTEIARFEKCVRGVEKDLRMQQSRTETLLRLLADRKAFLYGILQYQSMKASENSAKKAQVSADKMETMTVSMHNIARKTKQETVSMRIITLVTLFFLPGTFIGTFMSTDIIKFETNNTQHFQPQGLKVYLGICVPLMVATFLAWYFVYKSTNKGERPENQTTADGYSDSV
ncbi:hypothetical protein K469DRAFT_696760 [Zopfia rhizophila CBS 207.26]|uniref:CorA-like transporter domain-containing protein n=1 Tax=Zopfia rhizophila CBS 207.26 TaxID=1314779 RepID=A0A6A6EM59_9PEZI|nr:hypothetical protein K469DRAFT_696760 [Zopfia rhizophila CBS 207.26]